LANVVSYIPANSVSLCDCTSGDRPWRPPSPSPAPPPSRPAPDRSAGGRRDATVAPSGRRSAAGRLAYAVVAPALLAAIVFELARHSTGWWQLAAFGLGPDLALLLGAGEGLAQGQLHARAVPVYNAVHRFWGPAALAALASVGPLGRGFFVGALGWGFHVTLDRSLGYGLRTRDGFQRA
jgi:hypothetical protein